MPATANELLALGQGRFDQSDQALAEAALARVWGAVRDHCEWHVTPVKRETLVVDGTGGPILQLPTLRLVEVYEVRENGEVLDPSAVQWSADGSLRKSSGRWSDRWRGIEVDVEHGYASVDGLDGLVLRAAARELTTPAGQTRLRVGQTDEQFDAAFLASELELLGRYRLGTTG